MVNEHSLTVSLEEFGLSKYEAKAYVTLISKGTISASETKTGK
jgi:sugar-specific transcriptional regulator TrmB